MRRALAFPLLLAATVVSSGGTAWNRTFAQADGGIITGTVINAATTSAVANATVSAYVRAATGVFEFVDAVSTDASGVYTIDALPANTYYLHTGNSAGLIDEVYDNLQCLGWCDEPTIGRGAGVMVSAGATVAGRNFALEPGGIIEGTVLGNPGAAPIPGAAVVFYSRDSFGNQKFVGYATADASGAFSLGGLVGGTYYAYSEAPQYQNEFYDRVPCLGYCEGSLAATAGAPITVTGDAVTGNINFTLMPGGRITGVVRRAATSTGIPGASVYAFRSIGMGFPKHVGTAVTDASGGYTLAGLATGDYTVYAWMDGMPGEIYSGLSCPGECSTDFASAHGTLVHVVAAKSDPTGGVDFRLSAAPAHISGMVSDAVTSAPVANVYVEAYTRTGADYQYAGFGYTSADGTYQIDLAPGSYYLATRPPREHQGVIYGGIPCSTTCGWGVGAINSGTPVVLDSGTVTANFALPPTPPALPGPSHELWGRVSGGTVTLRWYEAGWGGVPSDFLLDVGLSPGSTFLTIPVVGTYFEHAGVPPGHYYFRVRGRNASGVGPPSGEFDLIVNPDGSGAPGAVEDLSMYVDGNRLYANWSEPWYGGFPIDYLLEAGTAAGLSNIGTFTFGSRTHFELEPAPPPGVYFVRVRGRNAFSVGRPSREFMLVVGGVPSPPDGPGMLGFSVDGARRVTVAWTAPRGPVSGYVLEFGTASNRYDLGAVALPASPTSVMTPGPVPPGLYFVRLRAVNASGAGPPSWQEVLFVP